MNTKLKTIRVSGTRQIRAFFDGIAEQYREAHGPGDRLLNYRLAIIRQLLGNKHGALLEIGCGTGTHLSCLADGYEKSIGTDLSPKMIRVARQRYATHPYKGRISFYVDPAETLSSIGCGQIDTVICIGAFEHMTDKARVLCQVKRVLKSGGEFICLMPNGGYCWYRTISRWLRLDTRHLSSDRFLTLQETTALLHQSGLVACQTGCWTFIPRGDMPLAVFGLLSILDRIGSLLNISAFRGGLYFKSLKASAPEYPIDE